MKSVKTILVLFVVLASMLVISSCELLEHPFTGVWKGEKDVIWMIITDKQVQLATKYESEEDLVADTLCNYDYDSKNQTASFRYRDGVISYEMVDVYMRLKDLNTIEVTEMVDGKLRARYELSRTDIQRGFTDLYEEEESVSDAKKEPTDPKYDFDGFSLVLYYDKDFELYGNDADSKKMILVADGGFVYSEADERLTLNYKYRMDFLPEIDFPSRFDVEDPGTHYVLRPQEGYGDPEFVFSY